MNIFESIYRKWEHFRLAPIRVFCLHHVTKNFDPPSMKECDWMSLSIFQQKILSMKQEGVKFISLTEAHDKLSHSHSPFAIRLNRYAVLTFDDGYASILEVLPWLKEQNIPVTLFINPDYIEGIAYRESEKERYLSIEDLSVCDVTIGMHGLQHVDVSKMAENEFQTYCTASINNTSKVMSEKYIPFWAYTWGRHNGMTDRVLRENNIIPVYIDGIKNYNESIIIHRELL